MTKREKERFFFRHFLSVALAIAVAAYFKVNRHEHADMVILVSCVYGLIVFFSFVRYTVKLKRRKV